jgi:two-component system, NtrC family, response regulator HupR/HoxA
MQTRAPVPVRPVVLVVDDEPGIREVLELHLKEHFEIETARSTHEAEMMLATRSFDVVVCDHLMPEEEGLPFLTRARKQFPQVQRIMITGYTNPELLSRCTAVAGLSGCLTKPVDYVELVRAIRLALPH